jgi:hypothetical protein
MDFQQIKIKAGLGTEEYGELERYLGRSYRRGREPVVLGEITRPLIFHDNYHLLTDALNDPSIYGIRIRINGNVKKRHGDALQIPNDFYHPFFNIKREDALEHFDRVLDIAQSDILQRNYLDLNLASQQSYSGNFGRPEISIMRRNGRILTSAITLDGDTTPWFDVDLEDAEFTYLKAILGQSPD